MTENQEVPGRKRRTGEEIKRLVLEFEASGLRQNEFCRNHGLALSTLQRQLKKRRLNESEAHAFLVRCRLRHARRLLAVGAGHLSVADVAGFSDQTHLTRHFRHLFGQAPGRWDRGHE
jgi:AraC-like DNA-binding protein